MMQRIVTRYGTASSKIFFVCFSVLFISSCQTTNEKKDAEVSDQAVADSTWAMLPFEKVDSVNPVLLPGNNSFVCPVLNRRVMWEDKDVFNPAAVVRDNKVYLVFRAEDKIGKHAGTSRLGLAVSDDGLHFSKLSEPVFYPDNDSLK